MDTSVPPGKFVVAVSGGVDSMVLLHLLVRQDKVTSDKWQVASKKKKTYNLIVAHFNHGIRSDASRDEELVRKTAEKYNLPFEVGYGRLGPMASEEQARDARYKFLNEVKKKHKADAIITAHHQDDLIETAFLNILRGSGRRGLTAIAERRDVLRPLLTVPKQEILAYAGSHKLVWREDSTNRDERHLRNYLRRRVVPKLTNRQRQRLLRGLDNIADANRLINTEIANLSQKIVKARVIKRRDFINLPNEIAGELLMDFLRQNGIRSFDRKTVERLTIAVKTAKPGSRHEIQKGAQLEITTSEARLVLGTEP